MAPSVSDFEQQLGEIYDTHAEGLYRYLLSFGLDESEARDALQEVFVRLAKSPEGIAAARSRKAWLFRIAHNLAIDGLRRREVRRRGKAALTSELSATDDCGLFAVSVNREVDAGEFRQRLGDAFAQLPDEQASVVQLKLWQGLTFAEIAEVQEISLNTAASRYRYGLDKLRALLRPVYEEIR